MQQRHALDRGARAAVRCFGLALPELPAAFRAGLNGPIVQRARLRAANDRGGMLALAWRAGFMGARRAARVRPRSPGGPSRVRILHLFANWKWTGPAEPALNLAWCQAREHEVLFVSGSAPDGQPSRILPHVEAREVSARAGFRLSKHARLLANRADVSRLEGLLEQFRPDIVHCHLDNDHRIGAAAVSRTGIGRLVRTAYDAEGLRCSLRLRRVAARALDGLVLVT
ncbi:MAG: glycosyltransferase, partial [Planctomycetes bacterium]|nr:glycosyltransferase [Planctomycetota bacterium]